MGMQEKNNNISDNILLQQWSLPPFEKIKDEYYFPAFEQIIAKTKANIQAIIDNPNPPDFSNTIVAIDRADWQLEDLENLFFNILEANSNETLQNAAEQIVPILVDYENWLAHNDKLFKKIKAVYDERHQYAYAEDEQTLLTKIYDDFVRNGAKLNKNTQQRFRQINKEIAQLTLLFNNNVLSATNDYQLIISDPKDLAGLPENIINAAKNEGEKDSKTQGKWIFTLHNPSLLPFLQYADNRNLREQIWQAYMSRCNGGEFDNNSIINKICE